MKRTFIGVKIEIDENFKEAIYSLRANLEDENIRWIEYDNLHITLAFIGDTEETSIINVMTMLQSKPSGFGKIGFALNGFGVFRNLKDPRIIFADIENPERLLEVFNIIKAGLEDLEIKIEERDFKPHLTIGRIKHLKDRINLQETLQQFINRRFQDVTVSEIVYYESILLASGPLYRPISKVML